MRAFDDNVLSRTIAPKIEAVTPEWGEISLIRRHVIIFTRQQILLHY
jgi:hypothetical protein